MKSDFYVFLQSERIFSAFFDKIVFGIYVNTALFVCVPRDILKETFQKKTFIFFAVRVDVSRFFDQRFRLGCQRVFLRLQKIILRILLKNKFLRFLGLRAPSFWNSLAGRFRLGFQFCIRRVQKNTLRKTLIWRRNNSKTFEGFEQKFSRFSVVVFNRFVETAFYMSRGKNEGNFIIKNHQIFILLGLPAKQ